MLYEYSILVEEGGDSHFYNQVFEAPDYTELDQNQEPVLHPYVMKFVQERAHEASVIHDFALVRVTISRFFPARVGFNLTVQSSMVSILKSWSYQCPKAVSR